jgi:acetyltransferase-like isoleucine patch superfamily enzyme
LETLADQLSYPFFREMREGEDEPVIDGPLFEGPVHVDYGFRINISNFANMLGNCIIIYTPFSEVRFGEHSGINPGLTIIDAERPQGVNDKNGKPLTDGRKVTIGGCSWIGDDVAILRILILSYSQAHG